MNDLLRTAKTLYRALEGCKMLMKDSETILLVDTLLAQAKMVLDSYEGEERGQVH
jgi:hypothetical protein